MPRPRCSSLLEGIRPRIGTWIPARRSRKTSCFPCVGCSLDPRSTFSGSPVLVKAWMRHPTLTGDSSMFDIKACVATFSTRPIILTTLVIATIMVNRIGMRRTRKTSPKWKRRTRKRRLKMEAFLVKTHCVEPRNSTPSPPLSL